MVMAKAKIVNTLQNEEGSRTMTKQQPFAEAMTELEEIVRKLEQGDVPLEEAIDLYKKGMELSQVLP